jgi:hypothetical protein
MIPVRKCSLLLILGLLGTYAGATLASPVASLSVRSEGMTVVQAGTDTPVDCKKNPKDPRCEKR